MQPPAEPPAAMCGWVDGLRCERVQVLACDATLGYEDHFNVEVLKFNGVPVENLRHLAQLAATCTHHFMRFDLEYQVSSPPPPPPTRSAWNSVQVLRRACAP